jgi:ABC-type transport system involved in cytochrome c biogenesis permease subunit
MSYLLFQISFLGYFLAMSAYIVFFVTQKNHVRQIARNIILVAGILHTLNIAVRYYEAGHTPITSQHETVSFFAWAIVWGYLSFRWRYTVKNFGTFVSVMTVALMFVAALASREILPSGSGPAELVASRPCLDIHHRQRLPGPCLHRRHHVPAAGTRNKEKTVRPVLLTPAVAGCP